MTRQFPFPTWEHIATAPRDGTMVLLHGDGTHPDFLEGDFPAMVGYWDDTHGWITATQLRCPGCGLGEAGYLFCTLPGVTHWMRLPKLPAQADRNAERQDAEERLGPKDESPVGNADAPSPSASTTPAGAVG